MGGIPKEFPRFFLVPLDKAGKDPAKCGIRRAIALLGTLIKLLKRVLVRRILPAIEGRLAGSQYAYEQNRIPDILLGDLDGVVGNNSRDGFVTYVVGLDIDGAFDSASVPKLVGALTDFGISEIIIRFVGLWLTRWSFRIKVGAQVGAMLSKPRGPTRGAPQGGVLSPLPWIVRIIEVATPDTIVC